LTQKALRFCVPFVHMILVVGRVSGFGFRVYDILPRAQSPVAWVVRFGIAGKAAFAYLEPQ
jgi:hypothetical protein